VGCVPCLNALTYIAVMNGHAYAVNGYAKDWAKRYSIRSGGMTMAVQDLKHSGGGNAQERCNQKPTFSVSRAPNVARVTLASD
jgi:hypothetical protein